jgi:hypothetical protein
MGLQNTNARNETTMRCFCCRLMRLYLGKLFARWVYKMGLQDGFTIWVYKIQTHAMTRRFVAFFVGTMRLYLGKLFARWVYKNTNARKDTTMRFLFWSERCVCILVNYLQDGFTKIQTHAMTRRCVAFLVGTMRLYLGKLFARWVYKNTNARKDTTMRFLFLSERCVCILVNYLQDGFTKYKRTR